jgi:hypothetical protein
MSPLRRAFPRCLLLAALGLPCAGQERLPNLQFSGFGTLGLAGTSTHAVGFRRDNTQPAIAAAIDKPTGNLDTRVGLQLSSHLSETLFATVQVMSRLTYDNTFKPGISLACLTWSPASNLQFRAGALNNEVLPSGDFTNIGYGYLWVRPPVDVFMATGASRSKGLDARQTFVLGRGTTLQVGAALAMADEKLPGNGQGVWDLSGGRGWAAFGLVQHGNLKVRGTYINSAVPRSLPGDYDAFVQSFHSFATLLHEPQLDQVANSLRVVGTRVRQAQLGAFWESGPYQVQGALRRQETSFKLLFPTTNSGFLSFGYRVGQVVPYAMYARAVSERRAVPDIGDLGSLPPFLPPAVVQAGQFDAQALQSITNINAFDQYTWTGGLRWDFLEGADLKFQVDRIRAHNSTAGVVNFAPNQPLTWDGRMTVVSVTLDFIFGGGR